MGLMKKCNYKIFTSLNETQYIQVVMMYEKNKRGIPQNLVCDNVFLSRVAENLDKKLYLRNRDENITETSLDQIIKLNKKMKKKAQLNRKCNKVLIPDLSEDRALLSCNSIRYYDAVMKYNRKRIKSEQCRYQYSNKIASMSLSMLKDMTFPEYHPFCYYNTIGKKKDYLIAFTPFQILSEEASSAMIHFINLCDKDCYFIPSEKTDKDILAELMVKAFITKIDKKKYMISPYILHHIQKKKNNYLVYYKSQVRKFENHTKKEFIRYNVYLMKRFLFHETTSSQQISFSMEPEPNVLTEERIAVYNESPEKYREWLKDKNLYEQEGLECRDWADNEGYVWPEHVQLIFQYLHDDGYVPPLFLPKGKQPDYETRVRIRDIAWNYQALLVQFANKEMPAEDVQEFLNIYITCCYQKQGFEGSFDEKLLFIKQNMIPDIHKGWFVELKRILLMRRHQKETGLQEKNSWKYLL